MSIVSNNIKYLRRLNGLTQEQFSRRIGIKRSLLGAYEEARANPNLENLKTIAQVFGTSVDSLIKTDIRKIRETPGITLGQSTTGIMEQVKMPPVPQPTKEVYPQSSAEPQPISKVINDFFQEEPVARIPQREIQAREIVPEPEPSYQPYHERLNHTNNNGMKNGGEAYLKNVENRIPYIKRALIKDYLANFQKTEYIKSLSTFTLPFINSDKSRAFEMGSDFPMPNSIVVGTYVEHWANILDGKFYVLITPQQGVIYRRVYNQIKVKGTLLLSSDDPSIPSFEISLKAVAEIWEVQAFISKEMPEPRLSLERAKSLIEELSLELNQLK